MPRVTISTAAATSVTGQTRGRALDGEWWADMWRVEASFTLDDYGSRHPDNCLTVAKKPHLFIS